MASFGSFALLIALALAAYNLLAGSLSLFLMASNRPARISPERMADTARRAGIAGFIAVSAAAFALVWSVFANDFSIFYIADHSNIALPAPYKFAALWSGQEGSLLLWAWLLAVYGFVLRLRHKTDVKLFAYAGTILAGVQLFFLIVLNFTAQPFSLIPGYVPGGPVPADGNGLNPLLQYPEMVIHPPLLYLGYVGFSVPFAFALGALMMRYPGEKWIKITRTWTMVTWLFLTAGIFLGMHWAYAVLGWGGYWGWDPVEIASLLPWLTGTAFLHSVMMQEKKGLMKSWNVWLIFSTFMLSILGTLLTRGGLVSSVHAFAQSSIGYWFIVFLVIVAAVCLFTYILQYSHVKSPPPEYGLVSRESAFLFNSLVFLTVCLVLLWGTLYPILSEYTVGNKVTLDAAWFNRIAVPMGLFLLMLTGVGPLLPWKSTSLRSLRRNFVLPVIALWAALIGSFALGVNPWKSGTFNRSAFYALVGFALSAGVLTAIFSEFYRGARVIMRQSRRSFLAAVYELTHRNTRRFGGYIVHLGVVIVVVGFAGIAFNQSVEKELALHDKIAIGPYTLECSGFTQDSNQNYSTEFAMLNVSRDGKKQFDMAPEHRVYMASQQPQTIVAIHSTVFWDLYVVYEGTNPDTGQPIVKAFLNPLVSWLWVGVLIMVLGTLVALLPAKKPSAVVGEEV
jgi:cytochrome c-type biogenesis protein CcmF